MLCAIFLFSCFSVFLAEQARAEWTPSPDLAFFATVTPDSATVGDPLRLELRGSGPQSGDLLWPTLADSIGSFAIEQKDNAVHTPEGDRVTLMQGATVALYRAGEQQLPSLPLLWVRAPGETLVAWSEPVTVTVSSVLPEDVDLSNPQAALQQLKDVKSVVAVSRPPILRWVLGAALAAALIALAVYLYRRRPRRGAVPAAAPARVVLAPDVAFERGLEALYGEKMLESARTKEFYAALSLLLREYVERRFEIPAVEATRSELLEAASEHRWLKASDRTWLSDWLLDSDLVKFAREDRLLSEARERAETARAWVKETTRTVADQVAAEAAAKRAQAEAATATATATATAAAAAAKRAAAGTGGAAATIGAARITNAESTTAPQQPSSQPVSPYAPQGLPSARPISSTAEAVSSPGQSSAHAVHPDATLSRPGSSSPQRPPTQPDAPSPQPNLPPLPSPSAAGEPAVPPPPPGGTRA